MKRKAYCLVSIVYLGFYLFIGRGLWFVDLERQARIGSHPVFSQPINIAEEGEFIWKVPREEWGYEEGDAKLSLVLDRGPGIPENIKDRSKLKLRVKIGAYAVPNDGNRSDRLIRNWYYTTDEPFSPGTRIWTTFGSGEIEYGLGGLRVYPYEEVFASVTVTTPEPELQGGNPRLKLVGKHDYAVFEHLPLLRFLRDGGLALSLAFVVGLAALAWPKRSRRSRET